MFAFSNTKVTVYQAKSPKYYGQKIITITGKAVTKSLVFNFVATKAEKASNWLTKLPQGFDLRMEAKDLFINDINKLANEMVGNHG